MTIKDHREWYKVHGHTLEPISKYTAASSTTEQASTTLLDNGTFTHRVDGQQPIVYSIEGLKYE